MHSRAIEVVRAQLEPEGSEEAAEAAAARPPKRRAAGEQPGAHEGEAHDERVQRRDVDSRHGLSVVHAHGGLVHFVRLYDLRQGRWVGVHP